MFDVIFSCLIKSLILILSNLGFITNKDNYGPIKSLEDDTPAVRAVSLNFIKCRFMC